MEVNPQNPNSLPLPAEPTQTKPSESLKLPVGVVLPHFPKDKPPQLSRHHNHRNPNLAIDILHDIEAIAQQWKQQLETVHRQIEILYNDGPIVEGWLESTPNPDITNNLNTGPYRTSYRLCGLDKNGQVWNRPCPSEQVASISLAIHRYQQLRQFLNHKHILEARLSQLAKSLTLLHTEIED